MMLLIRIWKDRQNYPAPREVGFEVCVREALQRISEAAVEEGESEILWRETAIREITRDLRDTPEGEPLEVQNYSDGLSFSLERVKIGV